MNASVPPGWYVDPTARDMLRWWDGEAWSDTDFKLAPNPAHTETKRDLLLGPMGRRGSVINVIFCTALFIAGIYFALNVSPFGWALAAVAFVLDLVFVVIAVSIRRFKIDDRIGGFIWPQPAPANRDGP